MFCVYCGTDHDEAVRFSDEDVIPYAIGGTRSLTIRVCERSNNTLGGEVDKPFIEYFAVRAHRFLWGLVGTDGTEPTLDLGGKSFIGDREVKVTTKLGKNRKQLKIGPKVTRTTLQEGQRLHITGEPTDVRKITEGTLKSQKAKGKWVKNAEGKIVELEDLDDLLGACTIQEIRNPCVVKTIEFDYLWSVRFFAKLALATGHYILGEDFSRSGRAAALRRAMSAKCQEEAVIPGVAVWPETGVAEHILARFRSEDSHVLAVRLGVPMIFFASLFGVFDAMIILRGLEPGELPIASTQGRILEVKLPSRRLEDSTLEAYVARRVSQIRPGPPLG